MEGYKQGKLNVGVLKCLKRLELYEAIKNDSMVLLKARVPGVMSGLKVF